jgi:hypothetical protein
VFSTGCKVEIKGKNHQTTINFEEHNPNNMKSTAVLIYPKCTYTFYFSKDSFLQEYILESNKHDIQNDTIKLENNVLDMAEFKLSLKTELKSIFMRQPFVKLGFVLSYSYMYSPVVPGMLKKNDKCLFDTLFSTDLFNFEFQAVFLNNNNENNINQEYIFLNDDQKDEIEDMYIVSNPYHYMEQLTKHIFFGTVLIVTLKSK